MTQDKIDITRPLKTRDGRKVRDLREDGHPIYPILGCIDGISVPQSWTNTGRWRDEGNKHQYDLIYADDEPKEEKPMIDWDKPLEVSEKPKRPLDEKVVWRPAYKRLVYYGKNGEVIHYCVNMFDQQIDLYFDAEGIAWRNDAIWQWQIRNAPEKKKIKWWVNVYPGDPPGAPVHFTPFDTKEEADKEETSVYTKDKRIACLKIEREYVEGEGLEGGE